MRAKLGVLDTTLNVFYNDDTCYMFCRWRRLWWEMNRAFHFRILTTKWRGGGTYAHPPLTFFCLELFDWFFSSLSAIFLAFKEKYWESPICCSDWNISPKHFFCPTTTYSGLCSSDHTCMKILFLVGFLGLGVIYSEKHFWVRRSSPEIM